MSNKTPYSEQGANKYYIVYLNGGLDIKLYTNHMNVLANDNELLKYIEIWNKIEALFNKNGFYSKPTYSNEYLRTKISSYNETFHDFKKLTKNEYCSHSILLLGSM